MVFEGESCTKPTQSTWPGAVGFHMKRELFIGQSAGFMHRFVK